LFMQLFRTLGALACISCALWGSGAIAQTINQLSDGNAFRYWGTGQSFKATMNGEIYEIAVSPVDAMTGDLYIYTGSDGSSIPGGAGTPVRSQPVSLVGKLPGEFQNIVLNSPLRVTAGSSYSFVFSDLVDLRVSYVDPYADGNMIFYYGDGIYHHADIAFKVYERAVAAPTTPAAIPSSSAWSLIGAVVFIMGAAVFQRRRNRR
jgi:hypothetical protein